MVQMHSVTKAQVSREQVYDLTRNAFPDCDIAEIRELSEGMFNTAYLITGSGVLSRGVVLKIGPSGGTKLLTYEKDILKTEIAVCRMLTAAGVPSPEILYADDTRRRIPSDYFFMTRIPGILWKDADPEKLLRCRDRLMHQLGSIHSRIHSITGSWFGYIKEDPRFQFDSWSKAFAAMIGDVCRDGMADGHSLPYGEILATVDRHKAYLDEVTEPRLVDFDMWAGNVLLTEQEDGYHISGIIDLERSFFGDPYADFVSSVMIFDDVRMEEAFLQGYIGDLAFLDSALIRMDLYRLYLTIIMYVETYRYEDDYAAQAKAQLTVQMNTLLQKLQ